MLVWEPVIRKVGLFESLSVLFAACHWQAPPSQEPTAEDQEEAFLHIFIVLLHSVSTVLHCMNKVYINVDSVCLIDSEYQIIVSSPFV